MLVISKQQMALLDVQVMARFKEKLKLKIQEEFPELVKGQSVSSIMSTIDNGIDTAYRYSITKEKDVFQMVIFTFLIGENIDRNPKELEIDVSSCGVRESGDPNGNIRALVRAYRDEKWTLTLTIPALKGVTAQIKSV